MQRHLPAYERAKAQLASYLSQDGVVVGLEKNTSCSFFLTDPARASAIVELIQDIEEGGTQVLEASLDMEHFRLVKQGSNTRAIYIVPTSLSVKQCVSLFSDTPVANRIYVQSQSATALQSLISKTGAPAYA